MSRTALTFSGDRRHPRPRLNLVPTTVPVPSADARAGLRTTAVRCLDRGTPLDVSPVLALGLLDLIDAQADELAALRRGRPSTPNRPVLIDPHL